MNQTLSNLKEVFSRPKYLLFGILTTFFLFSFFHIFTEYELIVGNFGENYLYFHVVSQVLISILFGIFFPASIYKYVEFSSFSFKENSTSAFGTIIGILAAGCPACSVTLASYIGLAGLLSLFPYSGLELKIISIPLLLYANYSVLKDLHTCKLKKK